MSLKNQNIIIFSQMQFDNRLESTNYIMAKLLAKDNFVYFIDRPYTWRDYIQLKNTPGFKRRKPHFFSPENSIIETDNPNLKIIITPPVPSINMLPEGKLYRMGIKFNQFIVGTRVKKIIERLNITNYIYINSYNFAYPTLHKLFDPTLTVYHCVDPIIEPYQTKHGLISEDILVKSVDMVISTSKELSNQKALLNSNSHFVPNAANIAHSLKTLNPDLEISPLLAGIKKPIIGYFGAIERRIDYSLLKELFKTNRDKSFVFIGPTEEYYITEDDFRADNVHFKERVPYEELPAILKGFAVAIIPFKKDEVSSHIFPLKLFEYLGSGRPVVSTDFNPDLRDFTHDTVTYCSNAREFTTAIEAAMNDTPELQEKRLEVAADNTWEHRIIEIKDLLQVNFDKKSKR